MTTKPVIIADSSPCFYQRVVLPPAVWDEVTVKGRGLPGSQAVAALTWLEIQTPEPEAVVPLAILVDKGEAEALALARHLPGSVVLLDDNRARRVAERSDIPRIGTVGILRRAKKAGFIPALKPLLEALRSNGIYISEPLVAAVLRDVGEI